VRSITEPEVIGTYALPDGDGRFPGVVALGGSQGGIPTHLAVKVAEQGYACLGLGYFGVAPLKQERAEIPVEIVESGVRWLSARPEVTEHAVGLLGVSRGAELALLSAMLLGGAIGAVVAVVPSSVVFFGTAFTETGYTHSMSSWTWHGEPLPFVPKDPSAAAEFTEYGIRTTPMFVAALANQAAVDAATIAVEDIRGPVLLLSGGDDQMWPSSQMAESIVARGASAGRADTVRHVDYHDAGHTLLGLPLPIYTALPGSDAAPSFDFGGTPEANATAAADAWPRIASFLSGALSAIEHN
jgi:dienelactone hydrolase